MRCHLAKPLAARCLLFPILQPLPAFSEGVFVVRDEFYRTFPVHHSLTCALEFSLPV